MDAHVEQFSSMLLPLISGIAATLTGISAIWGVYRFGLSAGVVLFVVLVALFEFFAISDYFIGVQISVVLVLVVVALGLIGAMIVKRIFGGRRLAENRRV